MESLDSLRAQLRDAEEELAKITIKKHHTVPWAPGVQDQFKSESYSYNIYSDRDKANRLKNKITSLENQIRTYPERARAERERQEAILESRIPKYEYTSAGKTEKTKNPALAARYNAQQRFFGMTKLQQTVMKLSGQKRKFDKLWSKATTTNINAQEEIAEELNRLFR